jgi:hypothetical protein
VRRSVRHSLPCLASQCAIQYDRIGIPIKQRQIPKAVYSAASERGLSGRSRHPQTSTSASASASIKESSW